MGISIEQLMLVSGIAYVNVINYRWLWLVSGHEQLILRIMGAHWCIDNYRLFNQ